MTISPPPLAGLAAFAVAVAVVVAAAVEVPETLG
jgi:hypothetical protein